MTAVGLNYGYEYAFIIGMEVSQENDSITHPFIAWGFGISGHGVDDKLNH